MFLLLKKILVLFRLRHRLDPYLYGGLQNTFYIHGFKLGVYFAYSLGGKIYNYSEIYMAGSHPVRGISMA